MITRQKEKNLELLQYFMSSKITMRQVLEKYSVTVVLAKLEEKVEE